MSYHVTSKSRYSVLAIDISIADMSKPFGAFTYPPFVTGRLYTIDKVRNCDRVVAVILHTLVDYPGSVVYSSPQAGVGVTYYNIDSAMDGGCLFSCVSRIIIFCNLVIGRVIGYYK